MNELKSHKTRIYVELEYFTFASDIKKKLKIKKNYILNSIV